MATGTNIKRARQRAGLSRQQLADEIDATRASVWLWETKDKTPRLVTLRKIARATKTELQELIGR